MEPIYSLRPKYREKRKNLHTVFIDLEKAYNRILSDPIWWVLDKRPRYYIDNIGDMYKGDVKSVRTTHGETCEFTMTTDLHQLSALSPYFIALIIDELTSHIQEKVPWCMFVDDIVLATENNTNANLSFEEKLFYKVNDPPRKKGCPKRT